MPRIWLDATVDDAEPGPSWRAPVPPIPEVRESIDLSRASPLLFVNGGSGSNRSSNSHGAVEEPHTPTISQRRRRAMPAPLKTTNARPRQRTSARRSHNNASPDVISSLVDSLATISAPANDHFDAIPTLGDAQSRAHSRPLRRVRSDDTQLTDGDAAFAGFSQTHPAATSANNNITTAAVDDAAIPPVIKTAPPPSGLSPLTAPPKPQKAPKESPVRAYFRSGSRTSLHSHRSSDMAHPSPSLDSVVLSKPESPTDSAAPPNISRTNRHKSLSQPASQEQLRQQPSEPPKPVLSLGEDPAYLGPQKSRQKVYIPRKKHTLDPPRQRPIAEEGQGDEIFGAKAAGKQRAKNFSVPGEPSPSVPQRQSSLAQTDGSSNAGSSKASSRKRSGKSEPASIRSTSLHSDVHKPTRGNMSSRIKKKESLKFEDVQDIDSEVVKRIKELKARKELRDREAQNNPQPVQPPERTTSVARHTRSASDPQPPAAVGEDAKVPAALKHLTLGSVAQKRPSSSGVAAAGQSTGVTEAQRLGQAQARSITPATPPNNVEPLPINYKYVMQKLEKAQARDGANATNGDSGTKVRPKSFSLVGRRKHTKTGADVSSGPDSHAGSPRTSMQDGRDDDENSLDFVLSRSTTKKERWSHPGPLKDGRTTKNSRANKEKVDSFAVKAVANAKTGTDGRPSTSHSVDSIDDDVKAFIYAPRLTQKIRHPQSGRTIAFSEVGDPKGYAVFCCVGMGLTRYITAFYDELATTLKLRLITPDRPGVGESQSDPNGTPLSWPGKFHHVLCCS
ncbi:MAG: hypothetical protein INR71_02235 [Terriglobus roseus]|nr:hypothetical protein [Terriglobus roseus]